MKMMKGLLSEAFEGRRFHKGKIKFSASSVKDQFLQRVMDLMDGSEVTDALINSLYKQIVFGAVMARAKLQQQTNEPEKKPETKPGEKVEPPKKIEAQLAALVDPTLVQVFERIQATKRITKQEIEILVNQDLKDSAEMDKRAPLLSETIKLNSAESTIFGIFEDTKVQIQGASHFNKTTFYKLIRGVQTDHSEFWPLKGFVDRRPLYNPTFYFSDDPTTPKGYQNVPTACATPHGKFAFNVNFMQKLIDWAYLKKVPPKGKKYVSNGGDIPDDYCYLEFVIMHEFMHYTNDDFYYQKIIPRPEGVSSSLHAKVINYVGDFRTNYLLVKSGYPQLPIGLFNDSINYDRQKSYVEMYRLVADELKKLSESQQNAFTDLLDELGDDHEPGDEEGEETDISDRDVTVDDIDENAERVEDQMKASDDADQAARQQNKSKSRGGDFKKNNDQSDQEGTPLSVDYTKVVPTFNWRTLVNKFISSAAPRFEETYAKPSRRAVSGLVMAQQRGAAAIKPSLSQMDYTDNKLAFVFDSSGSMTDVIGKVYANAVRLLKQPQFARTESVIFRYSGSYEMFKGSFAQGRAGKITDLKEKPKLDMKMSDIFLKHLGGGTNLSAGLASEVVKAVRQKYNAIFFIDADNISGGNLTNLMTVLKAAPKHVFIIFDSRETYLNFRRNSGFSSQNITYFQD